MRVETPQISWHAADSDYGRNAPLMTISVLPNPTTGPRNDNDDKNLSQKHAVIIDKADGDNGGGDDRVDSIITATAGSDSTVHLWKIGFRRPLPTTQSGDIFASNADDSRNITSTAAASRNYPQNDSKTGQSQSTFVSHLISLTRATCSSIDAIQFSRSGWYLAVAASTTIVMYSISHSFISALREPQEEEEDLDETARGNSICTTHTPQYYWSKIVKESDLSYKLISVGMDVGVIMDLSWCCPLDASSCSASSSPLKTKQSEKERFVIGCVNHEIIIFELQRKNRHQSPSSLSSCKQGAATATTPKYDEHWICIGRFHDHVHIVQGVTYDPLGVYVASAGADRTVRIYSHSPESSSCNSNKKKSVVRKYATIKYWPDDHDENNNDRNQEEELAAPESLAEEQEVDTRVKVTRQNIGHIVATSSTPTATTVTTATIAAPPGDTHTDPKNNTRKSTNISPRRHLFADEYSVHSFFRRLSWTADGAFLIVPSVKVPSSPILSSLVSSLAAKSNKELLTVQGKQKDPIAISSKAIDKNGNGKNDGLPLPTSPTSVYNSETTNTSDETKMTACYGTCIFARHQFEKPIAILTGLTKGGESQVITFCMRDISPKLCFCNFVCRPYCKLLYSLSQPSVVVRPCPILFKLPAQSEQESATNSSDAGSWTSKQFTSTSSTEETPMNYSSLPYRSIFAVLTLDMVLIYDTYHKHPLAMARGIHYAGLTDATWTSDGRHLLISSTDGYVSIMSFEMGELGDEYIAPSSPSSSLLSSAEHEDPPAHEMHTANEDDSVSKSIICPNSSAQLTSPPAQPISAGLDSNDASSQRPIIEKLSAETSALPTKKKRRRIAPTLISASSPDTCKHATDNISVGSNYDIEASKDKQIDSTPKERSTAKEIVEKNEREQKLKADNNEEWNELTPGQTGNVEPQKKEKTKKRIQPTLLN